MTAILSPPRTKTDAATKPEDVLLYPTFERLTPLQQCVADELARVIFLENLVRSKALESDHVPLRTKILADNGIDWVIDQVTTPNTPYANIRNFCIKKFPLERN